MTEAEWLACDWPTPMLAWIGRRRDFRRLRLFACACCRRISRLLNDDRLMRALEVAEVFADGGATLQDLIEVQDAADAVGFEYQDRAAMADADDPAYDPADNAARGDAANAVALAACTYAATAVTLLGTSAELAVRAVVSELAWESNGEAYYAFLFKKLAPADGSASSTVIRRERAAQAGLLRDIFGNPFRPMPDITASHAPAVIALADDIYRRHAFKRMPELADALVQAGCTDREIIEHCRSQGPHCRGCWVIDLLLGQS